jgi:membrane-bound lytic murein transglycosylase B
MPGSIYGAVGICQFMPSNILRFGVDGDGDGTVNLFHASDAMHSLANYLKYHGWKPGLSREKQNRVLRHYNNSATYANTILAVADALR